MRQRLFLGLMATLALFIGGALTTNFQGVAAAGSALSHVMQPNSEPGTEP